MIYRFQSSLPPYKEASFFDKAYFENPPASLKKKNWIQYRFGGCWAQAGLGMDNLKAPEITNQRAKFYFTEKGFHKFGRDIIAQALRYNQVLRVIRRKNPKKSQIVYQDQDQVAIIDSFDVHKMKTKGNVYE